MNALDAFDQWTLAVVLVLLFFAFMIFVGMCGIVGRISAEEREANRERYRKAQWELRDLEPAPINQ